MEPANAHLDDAYARAEGGEVKPVRAALTKCPSEAAGLSGRGGARVYRCVVFLGLVLRGEPLETIARELNVTAARLSEWRGRALAAAEAAMKERGRDGRDEELLRLRAKLGEVTMANELLERKVAALEEGRPLGRRRRRP